MPACLPTDASKLYVNEPAIVSGWGTLSSGGSTSNDLRETTVNIVADNDATCTPYRITSTRMCAYTEGTDSCQGDSGGPLVVKEDGRYTLVGVVSYGNGCAKTGYAGVYVRVTSFLDWINSNVADGWCGGNNPTQPPTTTAPTTAAPTTAAPTTASPVLGPVCDVTCIGRFSGSYLVNNIPVTCNLGICRSTDGSDLCRSINYPCGAPTTVAPTTPAPSKCDLTCKGSWTGNFKINGIYSRCSYGVCYATSSSIDLCKSLNYPCAKTVCDLTCHGSWTGNYSINGILSSCTSGRCYAKDGTNLCLKLNYPCGK